MVVLAFPQTEALSETIALKVDNHSSCSGPTFVFNGQDGCPSIRCQRPNVVPANRYPLSTPVPPPSGIDPETEAWTLAHCCANHDHEGTAEDEKSAEESDSNKAVGFNSILEPGTESLDLPTSARAERIRFPFAQQSPVPERKGFPRADPKTWWAAIGSALQESKLLMALAHAEQQPARPKMGRGRRTVRFAGAVVHEIAQEVAWPKRIIQRYSPYFKFHHPFTSL